MYTIGSEVMLKDGPLSRSKSDDRWCILYAERLEQHTVYGLTNKLGQELRLTTNELDNNRT